MKNILNATYDCQKTGGVTLKKKTLRDIDVAGKRVLVRVDFNVPLRDGVVTDNSRVKAALPTIEYLIGQGARIVLMSHLGRPKGPEDKFKLDPAAQELADLLGKEVKKVDTVVGPDALAAAAQLKPGEVMLLENLRFDEREKKTIRNLQSFLPGWRMFM